MRAAVVVALLASTTAHANERAETTGAVPVSLTPDGKQVGAIPAGETLDVVAVEGERLRVVGESRVARVMLYVPAKELPLVARAGALLVGAPGRSGGAMIALRAGTRLERHKDRQDGWQRVRWRDGDLRADGYVADEQLGHSYVPEDPLPFVQHDAMLRLPAALHDGPRGKALVTLRGREPLGVARTGDTEAGKVQVRLELGDARAEGWVDAARLAKAELLGRTLDAGRIGIPGKRIHVAPARGGVKLARGTKLYAAPGGLEVGEILADAVFARRGEGYEITGPWGPVVLYVR